MVRSDCSMNHIACLLPKAAKWLRTRARMNTESIITLSRTFKSISKVRLRKKVRSRHVIIGVTARVISFDVAISSASFAMRIAAASNAISRWCRTGTPTNKCSSDHATVSLARQSSRALCETHWYFGVVWNATTW